jgi:hypothetical protein
MLTTGRNIYYTSCPKEYDNPGTIQLDGQFATWACAIRKTERSVRAVAIPWRDIAQVLKYDMVHVEISFYPIDLEKMIDRFHLR